MLSIARGPGRFSSFRSSPGIYGTVSQDLVCRPSKDKNVLFQDFKFLKQFSTLFSLSPVQTSILTLAKFVLDTVFARLHCCLTDSLVQTISIKESRKSVLFNVLYRLVFSPAAESLMACITCFVQTGILQQRICLVQTSILTFTREFVLFTVFAVCLDQYSRSPAAESLSCLDYSILTCSRQFDLFRLVFSPAAESLTCSDQYSHLQQRV